MEGYWGMGTTVSSYSTAKRLEVGAPGGGTGAKRKKGQDPETTLRHALADRIENRLTEHLQRVGDIVHDHERDVLTLAHALEIHRTLSGEDVIAVLQGHQGPTVDGTRYHQPGFYAQIEAYHRAAVTAHRMHSRIMLALPDPVSEPASAESQW